MSRTAKLIDAEVVLKDFEDLLMSPWYNANYLSKERRLGMKEGLDMAGACVRYATEVEAIPVEWIRKYNSDNWFDADSQYNAIHQMLMAWERKEK